MFSGNRESSLKKNSIILVLDKLENYRKINLIKKLVKLFDAIGLFTILFKINKYINWWRWFVSGAIGDLLKLNFLKIEKSNSKLGYHNSNATKKGDIILVWIF